MNGRKRTTVFPESADDIPRSDADPVGDQDVSSHHSNPKKRRAPEQSSPTTTRTAHQSTACKRQISPRPASVELDQRTLNDYESVIEVNLGGKVTLAQSKVPNFEIVAIRKTSIPHNIQLQQLVRPCHPNIVDVHEIFQQDQSLYTIHECMSISLAQMNIIPRSKLGELEIAAVCKEVSQPDKMFIAALTERRFCKVSYTFNQSCACSSVSSDVMMYFFQAWAKSKSVNFA